MTTDYDKIRAIQAQLKDLRDELASKTTGAGIEAARAVDLHARVNKALTALLRQG